VCFLNMCVISVEHELPTCNRKSLYRTYSGVERIIISFAYGWGRNVLMEEGIRHQMRSIEQLCRISLLLIAKCIQLSDKRVKYLADIFSFCNQCSLTLVRIQLI